VALVHVTMADNLAEARYEVWDGEKLAAFTEYELTSDTIIFIHTEVEPEYEGHGVGGSLARFALDDARRRGLRVRPLCPFVKAWIERHPDYADLVD
jgi:predicted GNAT family acetyltransferase